MTTKHAYPRPQLVRTDWTNLNGAWEFAIDAEARWTRPDQVGWNATIEVPYAPETPASGIGDTSFYRAVWYRRSFDVPAAGAGERLILHFGAVDYRATVWVGEHVAVQHEGGYVPFQVDITDYASGQETQTITVRAEDDPHDLAKPRGKQDWQLDPHAIWYPRTTGIWQTVWLESVPATSIGSLRWTSNVEHWELGLEATVEGQRLEGSRLRVRMRNGERLLADDTYLVVDGEVNRQISLIDPGIDDYRHDLLWSPRRPTLIDVDVELLDANGTVLDTVASYTAMRSVGTHGDRFMLNGRPITLRLVLDQGYWTESGLSAPDDDALRRDVELVKEMGFNGVRKHQKIEDPRFLYWADKLGLLVWEEMPSTYRFSRTAVERLSREWTEAIARDASHPCVVVWLPFNESWGVPDLPLRPEQRNYVQALYHLTKTLDPTRPISGNDGWETPTTDLIGIHDYDHDPARIAERYNDRQTPDELSARVRPAGRVLLLEEHPYAGQPLLLSEFGGIAFSDNPEETWGYSRSQTAEEFAEQYTRLLESVRSLPFFTGFCYTQFTDTYQESNGLLYADRTPKFPMEQIALATRGIPGRRE